MNQHEVGLAATQYRGNIHDQSNSGITIKHASETDAEAFFAYLTRRRMSVPMRGKDWLYIDSSKADAKKSKGKVQVVCQACDANSTESNDSGNICDSCGKFLSE